jgi:Fur family ferric uptake transcriptional regulator
MVNQSEIRRFFQQGGLRMTAQRRAILEVISGQGGLLTAEDIYQQAKRVNPHISLATVYRTLTVLYEHRLIERRYVPGDHVHFRFELTGISDHFHFLCLGCGTLLRFTSKRGMVALLHDLCADIQVAEVTQVCACVEGYCQSCRERKAHR